MKKPLIFTIIVLFIFLLNLSCKKDWLEAKPQLSLAVPSTIGDYQALLDNTSTASSSPINVPFNTSQSALGEIGAGDFYVSDASLSFATPNQRNAYTWAADIFEGDKDYTEWEYPFRRVFVSNIVLDGIDNITPTSVNQQIAWDNVKGSAYFFRAYSHFTISQLFCAPFDAASANEDLGIPIRLTSDVNVKSVRSTVQETYDQILSDLKRSVELLPTATPINIIYKCRPNKAAANAMLARVYLSMRNYDSAFKYADMSLKLYDSLMNYTVDVPNTTITNPIPKYNKEVLFQITLGSYSLFSTSNLIVDSSLQLSYDINDIRRSAFFKQVTANTYTFKGSYDQSRFLFEGVCTDEVYLIRAECYARKGNTASAIQDLNTLLQKRWKPSTWVPYTAPDANMALKKILAERRKELCFRGLRWTDLRRLNKEAQFATALKRNANNQTITLAPNDPRYIFNIPPNVIELTGMQQNQR